MQITYPIHPTSSYPPVLPSVSLRTSSSPETVSLTPPCILTSETVSLVLVWPQLTPFLPYPMPSFMSFLFLFAPTSPISFNDSIGRQKRCFWRTAERTWLCQYLYNVSGEVFVYFIVTWHGLFFTRFGV